MQVKHYFGNAMLLNDRIIPDETLKKVSCINCGEVFELDIDSWAETENYVCDQCKLELKNNKTK